MSQRYYDRYKRDKKAKRFYNSMAWRRCRAFVLVRDAHLCQPCLRRGVLTPADAVHHKEHLRRAWDKALDADNLEAICAACHNRIHANDGEPEPERAAPVMKVEANAEVF